MRWVVGVHGWTFGFSRWDWGTYGEMGVHDAAAGEIVFGEMYDGVFYFGGEVHQGLFFFDLGVCSEALGFLRFGSCVFAVELLEALFAEGVDGGIFFEGGDELGGVLEVWRRGRGRGRGVWAMYG